MIGENISQESRLKIINETINCFFKEIEQNELMSKKHKKICTTLTYIEHFLILGCTITGFVSVIAFLLGIPIGITNPALQELKKYKSMIKKKKRKHDKIVFLTKSKLNRFKY